MGRNILVREEVTNIVASLDKIGEELWRIAGELERVKRALAVRQFEARDHDDVLKTIATIRGDNDTL